VGESAATAAAGITHGFPAELTSFVGRVGAVREVGGLLERYRLVTITGPGGAGKSRLATEVAKRAAGQFADGAWLVELARVADPAQVAAVVAVALGVREQLAGSAADAMAQVLARQQLLLVLDNCEHVIEAAAALCGKLLSACDDVRILATSREPLHVAAEARYRLTPLTLPEPGDPAHGGGAESVVLFVDRASRADSHFALTGQNGHAVARLVTRLDGMPLAIELAAARVEALGLADLLDHLGDRFALLAGVDRLAPARHRSLAATVEWSYQLLGEQEQRVFRMLSVFPGPFTLEAAGALAGEDARPGVLRLVDCSLLVPPRPGPDGRSRYAMLETLRAYGTDRLARAGERDGVDAALAGWALRVAEQAAAGLRTTTGELAAALQLDAEDATMRQMLAWAGQYDPATGLRLAAALAPWWLLRGRAAGEYQLLRELADRAEDGGQAWCEAQFWLGQAAMIGTDFERALAHFTAVCDAIGHLGPSRELADCLGGRSVTLTNLGQAAAGVAEGRRSLAMARELGYPAGEALALADLAIAANYVSDLDAAVRLARQADQIPADIRGWSARVCTGILAGMLIEAGDLDAAERTCVAGLARARDSGDGWNLAVLLTHRARLALHTGRFEDAAVYLGEGLRITEREGNWFELLNGMFCCGHLCAVTGRLGEAVTLWAACTMLYRRQGIVGGGGTSPSDRLQQETLRQAEQALGPSRFRSAGERGEAMSLAAAAEYALMLTAPSPQHPDTPRNLGELSARERQLITLVAQGRTDAQIAAQLFISVRTVGSHLDRIRDKTGCRRRADLTRLALSAGLV
jgi:predicted ATPase/DNA-binding CsgD family transcriptional regulator